jgi:SAM-dependent methyltransferase
MIVSREHDRCERFVDLDQVDVVDGETGAGQCPRGGGPAGHNVGVTVGRAAAGRQPADTVAAMTSRWDRVDAPRGDAYDARWARLAAEGKDPHGEVAFVQRYDPRSVLDAGCGTGRVAIELHRRGVATVGVDLDAAMLATARRKAPELEWIQADLSRLDLRHDGATRRFDVVVLAGNVMIFLEPGTEAATVAHLAAHLAPGGRLIAGFQLGGAGPTLADYDHHAADAGLALEHRFATWDADPFVAPGTYAVSVHRGPS